MTQGVELMWLIGREFYIGKARFRGQYYCDPCCGLAASPARRKNS